MLTKKVIEISVCTCDLCKKETNGFGFLINASKMINGIADNAKRMIDVCDDCARMIFGSILYDNITVEEMPVQSEEKLETENSEADEQKHTYSKTYTDYQVETCANFYASGMKQCDLMRVLKIDRNQAISLYAIVRRLGITRNEKALVDAREREQILLSKPVIETKVDKNGFVC